MKFASSQGREQGQVDLFDQQKNDEEAEIFKHLKTKFYKFD